MHEVLVIKNYKFRLHMYITYNFHILLTVHPNMIVFFYQPDAQILYFNIFIMFLYMSQALLCSSSG